MSLSDLIRKRIAAEGPITIAEYMSLALSHPEFGYYMRRDPLGVAGDFTTAPEISQIFGELVGAWIAHQWQQMGTPHAALVELGPGRGTLMSDMLRATRHVPGFHGAITVHLVETSPALREKQQQSLAGKHSHIYWHDSVEELPEKPLLLIANEFFDALPIRQFVHENGGWKERLVGLDEKGALIFVTPSVAERSYKIPRQARDDGIYEINEPAETIADILARHVKTHGGAALIIDYGYEHGHGDTLQAVKSHTYHPVLESPGEADLTAHVDFSALKNTAASEGVAVFGPVSQAEFLSRLGIEARAQALLAQAGDAQKAAIISGIKRLLSPKDMGDLFKVMCIASPVHLKPEGF